MDIKNIIGDESIEFAKTPTADLYKNSRIFELIRDKVFASHPFWIGHQSAFSTEFNLFPIEVYPGLLDESLLLSKTKDFQLLSNVCTHRAAIIEKENCSKKRIICPYHGRRWDLSGEFQFMPGFSAAKDFPSDCDHLKKIPLFLENQFLWGNLEGNHFQSLQENSLLNEYLYFFPFENLSKAEKFETCYSIDCNWALYCENYLEGFHIPFVHPGLNEALSNEAYPVTCKDAWVLQIGMAADGTSSFDLPKEHPNYGSRVGAFYFYLFPSTMLNFYPWGLSVNQILPQSKEKVRVKYQTYLLPDAQPENSAGAGLDKVEMEDQEVVLRVQQGIGSRFYSRGRYSPEHEKGVYHFHQLIRKALL